MTATRPRLTTGIASTELLRWYWLKDELSGLARQLGISASGGRS